MTEELIPVRRADCGHYVPADHQPQGVSPDHGYPVELCNDCFERLRAQQRPQVVQKVPPPPLPVSEETARDVLGMRPAATTRPGGSQRTRAALKRKGGSR